MRLVLEIHNLSKKYYIAPQNDSRFLREELEIFIRNPFGFFVRKKRKKREFWALKHITFSAEKGKTIGVIGPNGAGKSTLLKILAGIVIPSSGKVILRGTVGSLLDVGIGFHPELSGRENIFFSAATLGLKKAFVAEKFNDIVAFSEIGKFLDTPVKYYSSGMYVRLAFSIAIQLDPDILLIDEILMAGDTAFQKKSFVKIRELIQQRDRTVVITTHNMDTIKKLCDYVYYIKSGVIVNQGPTAKVVRAYLSEYA